MTGRICPACRESVENNVTPSGHCVSCGHDLVSTAPPPQPHDPSVNLRAVAKWQRSLLWFVLAILVFNLISVVFTVPLALPPWAIATLMITMAGIQIAALVTIVQLQAALGVHVLARIFCAILMFVPCINVIVLVSVNGQATGALQRAGLKVGLMGVTGEQVTRVLAPNRCSDCGYLLGTGVAAVCPECGSAIGG